MAKFRFPMRAKILLVTVLLIAFAVGTITFTMAGLFHTDKSTYIKDLSTLAAVNVSTETRSILEGYIGQLKHFAGIMLERELPPRKKMAMLKNMFNDFPQVISVSLYNPPDAEPVTIFDNGILEQAGLTAQNLSDSRKQHPLPMEKITASRIHIENSSIPGALTMMTLAIRLSAKENIVVSARFKLSRLMKIASRTGVFDTFIIDANNVFLAHSNPDFTGKRKTADWIPDLQKYRQKNTLGSNISFQLDGTDMVAGIAPVQLGGLLSGVQIPKSTANLAERELLNNLTWVSLGLLVFATLVALLWARGITRPVENLSQAAQRIAGGNFDIHLKTSADELGDLARTFNQMAWELKQRECKIREQAQINLELSNMATRDGLTGLFNHRYFRDNLILQVAKNRRSEQPFSLIFLDVDNFKQFNDSHGHLEGDELLCTLASILRNNARDIDIVARYGGEEFVLLLMDMNNTQATAFANRLLKKIAEHNFAGRDKRNRHITVSMGIATFPDHGVDDTSLIVHADKAVYQAKERGKNQVVCWE